MNNQLPKQDITFYTHFTNQPSGCSSCSAKQHCGLGFFAALFPRKHLKPEGTIPENIFIQKVFLLYIMPLLGIIAGSAIAEFIYPDNLFIAIIFALVGFMLTTAILLLSHLIPNTKNK